jgi:hypothetical protein
MISVKFQLTRQDLIHFLWYDFWQVRLKMALLGLSLVPFMILLMLTPLLLMAYLIGFEDWTSLAFYFVFFGISGFGFGVVMLFVMRSTLAKTLPLSNDFDGEHEMVLQEKDLFVESKVQNDKQTWQFEKTVSWDYFQQARETQSHFFLLAKWPVDNPNLFGQLQILPKIYLTDEQLADIRKLLQAKKILTQPRR